MTLDKKTVSFNKGLLLGVFFCLLTAAVSHGAGLIQAMSTFCFHRYVDDIRKFNEVRDR